MLKNVDSKLKTVFINGMLSVRGALVEINALRINRLLPNLKLVNGEKTSFVIYNNYNNSDINGRVDKKMKKFTLTHVTGAKSNNLSLCETETANDCDGGGPGRSSRVQSYIEGQNERRGGQEEAITLDRKVRGPERSVTVNERDHQSKVLSRGRRNKVQSKTALTNNHSVQHNIQSYSFDRVLLSAANIPLLPPHSFHRCFSDTVLVQQKLSNVQFRRNNAAEYSGSKAQSSGTSRRNSQVRKKQSVVALRSWQMTNFGKAMHSQNGGKYPGFFFTVMSYNVLAQDLIEEHTYLYDEHIKEALKWEVRWSNLITEIKQFDPEILCLQEVQGSHIEKYYVKLKDLGYDGVYKQRTGIRTDGCAIYYKADLIDLVEHETVEFNQPNISILNRDNVAIIAKLSPKSNPDREFVVATTHLLYNPRRQDVRVAQTQVLLAEIDRIAFRHKQNGSNYLPVILTGDFNSVPQSAVYEFITRGSLQYADLAHRSLMSKTNVSKMGKVLIPSFLCITDHCQHENIVQRRTQNVTLERQEELRLINLQHSERATMIDSNKKPTNRSLFSSGTLSHDLAFKSVYNHFVNGDSEATTYQDEWVTVDYIFYSGLKTNNSIKEHKLKLLARYLLPMTRQLDGVRIPNFSLGSDHLALLAKFKLEF